MPPGGTGKERGNAHRNMGRLKEGPLWSPSPWSLRPCLPPGSPAATLPSRRTQRKVEGKLSCVKETQMRGHASAHAACLSPAPQTCALRPAHGGLQLTPAPKGRPPLPLQTANRPREASQEDTVGRRDRLADECLGTCVVSVYQSHFVNCYKSK